MQSDRPVLPGHDAGRVEACGDPVGEQAQRPADEHRNEREAQVVDGSRGKSSAMTPALSSTSTFPARRLAQSLDLGGKVARDARVLPRRVGEGVGDHDLLGGVEPAAEVAGPGFGARVSSDRGPHCMEVLINLHGSVVAPRPNRPWREEPNAGGKGRR